MKLLSLILLIFSSECSFSQVVINELMVSPRSGEPEWIELYNPSQTAIIIEKAKLKDLSGAKDIGDIFIEANDYLVVCSDTIALKTFYNLPSTAKLLQKTIPSLNNTIDAILLLDSNSQIVDSIYYDFKWGAAPYSLERFDFALPASSSANWKKCILNSFATPNAENSIAKRYFDVSISQVISGNDSIKIIIVNIGRNKSNAFQLTISAKQILFGSKSKAFDFDIPTIQVGDSNQIIIPKTEIAKLFNGAINITAICLLDNDQNRLNDTANFSDFISAPESNIRINEIMYDPETDFCEFFELFNPSQDTVALYGLQYYENASAKSGNALLSLLDTIHFIAPDDYFVVASDSSILKRDIDSSKVLIANKNLELNSSDGDLILLKDANGITLDSLVYSSDWHSKFSENNKNKSLEKLNPFLESKLKSSWTTSTDLLGSTPTKENSSLVPDKDNTISIDPNPFIISKVKDGICKININTDYAQAKITAQILDLTAAVRRTITLAEPVGKEINLLWDGKNDKGDALDSGAYLFYYEITNLADGEVMTGKELIVIGQ